MVIYGDLFKLVHLGIPGATSSGGHLNTHVRFPSRRYASYWNALLFKVVFSWVSEELIPLEKNQEIRQDPETAMTDSTSVYTESEAALKIDAQHLRLVRSQFR